MVLYKTVVLQTVLQCIFSLFGEDSLEEIEREIFEELSNTRLAAK